MSVINTNITSMIGQSNLSKSQNALQTSMERLSSGLRINSAKDDAAGQAIANRMTSQITGLAQAQRNANDGISVAQTAEGALNQVNDNLQRIRELSVQAQNGTNSENDLQSIQDEIGQRLNEINRISEETSFNGVRVLSEDQGLKIQVGANDGESISVNLKEMTSSTLGLGSFNVTNMMNSTNIGTDAVTTVGTETPFITTVEADVQANATSDVVANIEANSIDLSTLPQDSDVTADGVFKVVNVAGEFEGDYAVRGSDGNFYALTENEVTNQFVWDSSSTALDPADIGNTAGVDVASGEVATVESLQVIGTARDGSAGNADFTALAGLTVDGNTDFFGATAADVNLARRNDVEVGYAAQDNDGNWYAVDVDSAGVVTFAGGVNPATNPEDLVQVSAANVGAVLGDADSLVVGSQSVPSISDNLYNVATSDIPTADGLYALADGTGFVVKGSNESYYAATVDSDTGEVSWDSSTTAIDGGLVVDDGSGDDAVSNISTAPTADGLFALEDGSGYVVKGSDDNYYAATVDNDSGEVTWDSSTAAVGAGLVDESAAVTDIVVSSVSDAAVTGLGAGESLVEVLDDEGNFAGSYVVKSEDASGKVSYFDAAIEINSDNEAVVTKGDAKTVDAMASLDSALNQVDSLRSELGAVQNRFEDAITNLNTNETNLAAARSRIEDADYAVEVANMTRAQILQQAGTSVLAQANQIPQSVLSLLG